MESFRKLGLDDWLIKTLEELKFKEPSEIQEKAIPLALAGKDVIGGSATGSGKTLAFGANILHNVTSGHGIQALILTPTRELAEQVTRALEFFSKYKKLKIVSVYGGVSINPQIEELQRAEIVVGTPGRVLDHLGRNTLNLRKVRFLVLDEADRMLDMGFLEDVERIIRECPKERQTFLFSATISADIARIASKYMKNPSEVEVDSRVDPSKLKQVFYDVAANEKFSLLVHLLKQEESKLVMVFCNTKRSADFLGRQLKSNGFNALALHGDLSQNRRNAVLDQFNKSEKFILVCTDVAARGLDIKNVSHVYNYDSPKTSTEYIHRIGRTARAGKEGKAITILGSYDYENFQRVMMDETLNIEKLEKPEFPLLRLEHERPRSFRGSGNYRRGSGRGYSGERGRFGGNPGGRPRSRYGDRPGIGRGRSGPGRFGRRSYGERTPAKFSW
jgi:ATP-dependent RNA helicase DeaD